MADLRNIIRQLAAPDGETAALVCTVDAVDEASRTIDCTPLNEGAPLLGVNLQANQGAGCGVWLCPEVGSYVVGFVADGAAGVVLATEEIKSAEIVIGEGSARLDKDGLTITAGQITLNGGDLGGLVVIQKLTDKLNELKDTLNSLITAYNSHTHITTATVGSTATPGTIAPTTSTATAAKAFNKEDYENTKIKQ